MKEAARVSRYCYAYASGLVEFGDEVPEGALPVFGRMREGDQQKITMLCRRSYEGYLLIPGLPEARNEKARLACLESFVKRVKSECELVASAECPNCGMSGSPLIVTRECPECDTEMCVNCDTGVGTICATCEGTE